MSNIREVLTPRDMYMIVSDVTANYKERNKDVLMFVKHLGLYLMGEVDTLANHGEIMEFITGVVQLIEEGVTSR